MRRTLLAAGILLALVQPAVLAAPSTPVARQEAVVALDRVVAIVNNEAITERELAAEMARIGNQLKSRQRPVPPTDILMPQVLERMIQQRTEIQYARQSGISIDDLSLDNAVRGIASDNGMTVEQFRVALAKEGTEWASFREQVRREITLGRLHKREVLDRMQISDKEIDDYLAGKQIKRGETTELHVRHILIGLPESATPDDIAKARAKAEGALKDIQSGADFASVASRVSEARDALDGGDLGWRSTERMPTIYLEAAKKLEPGQVSELIRSPGGFHIIQLVETRGAQANDVTLTETRARHILILPRENVSDDEARRRLDDIRARLAKGEDFATLARTYSDDKGSAERGGDLGWARPGTMVEAFEQVMNASAPGQVSAPFRSQFGWHILEVLERRDASGNAEFLRQQAREAVGRRKAEEELERWQRRLRDEAFVEILVGPSAGNNSTKK
ncbi:MAG: peptidylprolyl isomerase [Pseudomonadota bacterium]